MCNKGILENCWTIKSVSACYKNQEMCNKAVDIYPHVLEFVSECFKTQEMYHKTVTCFLISFFLIIHCPDKNITQTMSGKAVDDSQASLKLIADCFLTSKMIKKRYTALYPDDNLIYFNGNCDDVVFSCNEMGVLSVDLNIIHLENNFYENDPNTIILIIFLA